MAAPPAMVQQESVPLSSTSPKTTAAFDVLRDDILVAYSTTNGHDTTTDIANSGSDLGWTVHQEIFAGGRPGVIAWGARVIEDTVGMTVTFTKTGPDSMSGMVLTFRGALDVGATTQWHSNSGQPSVLVMTSHPNSAIVNVGSHEGLTDGAARVWRTANAGSVTELTYASVGSLHVEITGYHPDAGVLGLKEVGLTGLEDGFKTYAFLALEVMTNDLPEELKYTRAR